MKSLLVLAAALVGCSGYLPTHIGSEANAARKYTYDRGICEARYGDRCHSRGGTTVVYVESTPAAAESPETETPTEASPPPIVVLTTPSESAAEPEPEITVVHVPVPAACSATAEATAKAEATATVAPPAEPGRKAKRKGKKYRDDD